MRVAQPKSKSKSKTDVQRTEVLSIIDELDKTIDRLRRLWLKAKGEPRIVLREGIDELLDERLRLMKKRDAR